jgi:hypothetical protein
MSRNLSLSTRLIFTKNYDNKKIISAKQITLLVIWE